MVMGLLSPRRCLCYNIKTETLSLRRHSGLVNSLPLEVQLNWNYHVELEIDVCKFLASFQNQIVRNLSISILL